MSGHIVQLRPCYSHRDVKPGAVCIHNCEVEVDRGSKLAHASIECVFLWAEPPADFLLWISVGSRMATLRAQLLFHLCHWPLRVLVLLIDLS